MVSAIMIMPAILNSVFSFSIYLLSLYEYSPPHHSRIHGIIVAKGEFACGSTSDRRTFLNFLTELLVAPILGLSCLFINDSTITVATRSVAIGRHCIDRGITCELWQFGDEVDGFSWEIQLLWNLSRAGSRR